MDMDPYEFGEDFAESFSGELWQDSNFMEKAAKTDFELPNDDVLDGLNLNDEEVSQKSNRSTEETGLSLEQPQNEPAETTGDPNPNGETFFATEIPTEETAADLNRNEEILQIEQDLEMETQTERECIGDLNLDEVSQILQSEMQIETENEPDSNEETIGDLNLDEVSQILQSEMQIETRAESENNGGSIGDLNLDEEVSQMLRSPGTEMQTEAEDDGETVGDVNLDEEVSQILRSPVTEMRTESENDGEAVGELNLDEEASQVTKESENDFSPNDDLDCIGFETKSDDPAENVVPDESVGSKPTAEELLEKLNREINDSIKFGEGVQRYLSS